MFIICVCCSEQPPCLETMVVCILHEEAGGNPWQLVRGRLQQSSEAGAEDKKELRHRAHWLVASTQDEEKSEKCPPTLKTEQKIKSPYKT
jgi:hypothetical protein